MILLTINKVTDGECLICYSTIQAICKVLHITIDELLRDHSVIIIDTNKELPRIDEISIPLKELKPIQRIESKVQLANYPCLIKRERIKRITTVRRLAFTHKRNLINARRKRYEFRCHGDK